MPLIARSAPKYGDVNSPFFVEQKILEFRANAKLHRVLVEGEQALKAQGTTYLYQRPLVESDENFAARLQSSSLVNAFQIGVSSWANQLTGEGIRLSEEAQKVHAVFKEVLDKADIQGNNLNVFAGMLSSLGIGTGAGLVLVDGPAVDGLNINQRDAAAAGHRPYLRLIDPYLDLLGCSSENGVLTGLRVQEKTERVCSGKKYEKEYIYSALEYNLRDGKVFYIRTENLNGVDVPGEEKQLRIKQIPVVAYIPGEQLSELTGQTPVPGLADMTIAHWNSWSLQNNVLMVARTPFLFAKGFLIDLIKASLSTIINVDKNAEHADLKYVEVAGTGIEQGFRSIDYIEAAIRQYGVEITKPTGQDLATTKILDNKKTRKQLQGWAEELTSTLQQVFAIVAQFVSSDFPESGIIINSDFGETGLTTEQVALIKLMIEQGFLDGETSINLLKSQVKELKDVEWAEVKERLSDDAAQKNMNTPSLSSLFS